MSPYVVYDWPLRPLCFSSKPKSQPGSFYYTGFTFDTNFSLNFSKVHEECTIFFCHTVVLAEVKLSDFGNYFDCCHRVTTKLRMNCYL